MTEVAQRDALLRAARGGRVAHSGFLEPDASAALTAALRAAGVRVNPDGGYAGARRRVVTAFPDHIPEAGAPLAAVFFPGVDDADALRAAIRTRGVAQDRLGDAVEHQDGLSLITFDPPEGALLQPIDLGGRRVEPERVALEHAVAGSRRDLQVVVPSLRVDALGAKAFRVSRSYFSKGIAGGKVSINGRAAGKSATAEPGDEVYAEGLGRFTVLEVEGETRRGNLKARLRVERG